MAASRRSQEGASLVSMLVGLLLSMVAVLSMMLIYRQATSVLYGPGGMVPNARLDQQQAAGLLSAQMRLQAAGFRVPSASAGSQLLLLSGASVGAGGLVSGTAQAIPGAGSGASPASGNALLWETNPSGAATASGHECQGLWVDPSSKALYLLSAGAGCAPLASQWNVVTWQRSPLVAPGVSQVAPVLSVHAGRSCWPFGAAPTPMTGVAAASAPVEVQLTYQRSAASLGNQVGTVCLPNFLS
ncbi:MAG: hypothetical protein E6Q92_03945 [Burkholderiaceae bacterium]|nr:MAG: hypothetical protein E6Q92_03945 [Burkholderiaceae bacterium]